MMGLASQNVSFVTGFVSPNMAVTGASIGSVFDVATLSSFAPDTQLENMNACPHFSRSAVSTSDLIKSLHEALNYFESISTGLGSSEAAIISDVDSYTIDYAAKFIKEGELKQNQSEL
mmetsp:Transcript_73875/g.111286  ORF Transcript_73875/g.111286 Transcript_73875/m.111286 type:complete len:118 (+) Transcript_73875:517-870(+)